jgi:hypothetical protein
VIKSPWRDNACVSGIKGAAYEVYSRISLPSIIRRDWRANNRINSLFLIPLLGSPTRDISGLGSLYAISILFMAFPLVILSIVSFPVWVFLAQIRDPGVSVSVSALVGAILGSITSTVMVLGGKLDFDLITGSGLAGAAIGGLLAVMWRFVLPRNDHQCSSGPQTPCDD